MPDGSPIIFDIQTPKVDCAANVAHTLSLKLPEADSVQKHLHLIANGPSAKDARVANMLGDTMAVNGALSLFGETGPTYWIACDPQELVTQFLDNPPRHTIYLLASKCHPALFRRLANRIVRVWHLSDADIPDKRQVPVATSVTLCALLLAQRLGYRSIDVWGWDCCFDGDEHHAATGDVNETAQRIEMEVQSNPPKTFVSNPTWACEIEDAKGVLPVLRWAGVDVKIHGHSMVAAVLPEFAHA